MLYIESFKEGDRIRGIYLCKGRTSGKTKAGKDYETLIITDKTGQIEAKIWEPDSPSIKEFEAGDFIEITGDIIVYSGKSQMKVFSAARAQKGDYIPSDYMLTSRFDLDLMMDEVKQIISSVKNKYINELLVNIFEKDGIVAERFKTASAAKSVHHAFVGGLLEHSLSVAKFCIKLCELYDYLNYDLLVACALMHDIGKIREISPFPENDYTDEGNLIGHIVIGYGLIRDEIKRIEGFPDILEYQIEHCILSHHGSLEFGSPKVPALAEAKALAAADNSDAHLEIFREELEKKNANSWIDYNRFLETRIRRTEV